MNTNEIQKSKLTQIEALADSIKLYFGSDNKQLDEELTKLSNLVKEEKENRQKLSDLLNFVANRT